MFIFEFCKPFKNNFFKEHLSAYFLAFIKIFVMRISEIYLERSFRFLQEKSPEAFCEKRCS